MSVFRFPLINGLCNGRSVQSCANAARTHHTFPLQPFTSLSKTMKVAAAVSLSQLSKVSPTSVRVRVHDIFSLLSLRVVLEYSDFSA